MSKSVVNLSAVNKIFFIGIGGIGISAAARILNQQGKIVLGSDATSGEITEQLEDEGIKVFIGQQKENITSGIDLVVHTVAVPEDNPERQQAKEFNIPEITYPQLLGQLMIDKYGIGISGTNGKTTTSSMTGLIFMEAGLDPTIVIGGKTQYFGGNSRIGESKYFIFESDEYRRAFINYNPKMAVVTYITSDHLDYYKNIDDIKSAFSDYLKRVPEDGFVFINNDDANSQEVISGCQAKIITFGIKNKSDIEAKSIKVGDGQQSFDLYYFDKNLGQIILHVPAMYNIYNALAAIGPALQSGIDFEVIKKTLGEFNGTWRRFEKLGQIKGVNIIADYAHTPDAVEKTISAMKEFYPGKKVLVIFQPHQYSRTKNFFNEFVASFDQADQAIILDIFYVQGRENPEDFDVSAQKMVDAISQRNPNVKYGDKLTLEQLSNIVDISDYDVMLIMGAGDIYNDAKEMIKFEIDEELEEKLDEEEELEEKYGKIEDEDLGKIKKVKGTGFAKQKEVMEENRYYEGSLKKAKKNKI